MFHPDHCAAPSKKKTNGAERWMNLSFGEDFPHFGAPWLQDTCTAREWNGVYLCPTQSLPSQPLFCLEGKGPLKQPSLTVFDQKKWSLLQACQNQSSPHHRCMSVDIRGIFMEPAIEPANPLGLGEGWSYVVKVVEESSNKNQILHLTR